MLCREDLHFCLLNLQRLSSRTPYPPRTPSLTTLISFHLDFCDLRGPGSRGGGGRKSVAITQGSAHHFWVFLINTEGVCQQSPKGRQA